MSACHLAAGISALLAGVLLSLELALALGVLVSYLVYLRDRIRSFTVQRRGIWHWTSPELIIGEQSASLSHFGDLGELRVPRVIYFSEFLLVLSFRPEVEKDSARAIHLVLWPDSLARNEDRRLRRYLRFDLPASL